MKNLKSAEIYLISGGACKTEITALTSAANEYINKIPKPQPGTCIIAGDLDIPGLKNIGDGIIGSESLNLHTGSIELICKCSDEYPADVFTVTPYVQREL